MKYGDVRFTDELQFSVYNFEAASVELQWSHFNQYERECSVLIEGYGAAKKGKADELVRLGLGGLVDSSGNAMARGRFPLLAAYDLCLKCLQTSSVRRSALERIRAAVNRTEVTRRKLRRIPPEGYSHCACSRLFSRSHSFTGSQAFESSRLTARVTQPRLQRRRSWRSGRWECQSARPSTRLCVGD